MRIPLAFGSLSLVLLSAPACSGDDAPSGSAGGGTTGAGMTTSGAMTDAGETPATEGPDSTAADTDPTMGGTDAGDSSSTGGDVADTTGDGETTTGGVVADCDFGYSTLVSQGNSLGTNLVVEGPVNCDVDINIVATGGSICATDDGNGGYFYTVEVLTFEDVQPVDCGIAMLGISSLSIENIGNYEEVVVPMAGGDMVGNQSIQVLGDAFGSIAPTPLDGFVGVLPEGNATIEPTTTTVTYADDVTVIAVGTPNVLGFDLTVTLTGLSGTLTFDN